LQYYVCAAFVTDGQMEYCGLSVCWSVVSPAKMAEPIEMLFGCGLRWAEGTVYYMVVDPA